MAHIPVPEGLPGIFGLITAYPEPAKHLAGLAQALLRGPSSLTPAEREMIAALARQGALDGSAMRRHGSVSAVLSFRFLTGTTLIVDGFVIR